MKIVVISITPYKEKDGIINAISSSGPISFTARCVFDPKHKNSAINNNLVIADIDLIEGHTKYLLLKNVEILETPLALKNDLDFFASVMTIAEITKDLLQDEDKVLVYEPLLKAIECLKTSDSPWKALLYYFGNFFKASGYEFEVNKCVFCGSKKDIITFSFIDGGFVCRNCLEAHTEKDLSNEQMLLLRSAFTLKDLSQELPNCTRENALALLHKFFIFIEDSFNQKLKSSCLFK